MLCATAAALAGAGCALIPETPIQPPADLDAAPVLGAATSADPTPTNAAADDDGTTPPEADRGEDTSDDPTADDLSVEESSVDEAPVDEASVDEASEDVETGVDEAASAADPTPSADAPGFSLDTLRPGDGAVVDPDGAVVVRMTGRLADGAVFQRFTEPTGPWPVDQLVAGLRRGLEGMKVGERRRITIPPALGYGATGVEGGAAPIPPDATLVYEIDLLEVIPSGTSASTAADGGASP